MGGMTKMLDPITNLIGGLFGGGAEKEAPTPPPVAPPPVMPVPDDAAVQAAKRRSIAMQLQRRGRQSTILTDPVTGGDGLGG